MTKNGVSFRDLSEAIGDFRDEMNNHFDKIERIFENHSTEQNRIIDKLVVAQNSRDKDMEKRINIMEKSIDKIFIWFTVVGAGITIGWNLLTAWLKKELNL